MPSPDDASAVVGAIGSVHAALRRDLVRARLVVEGGDGGGARRVGVAEHLLWLTRRLHLHHEAEDRLFRLVVRRQPAAAPLVSSMDAEHGAIARGTGLVEESARELRDDVAGSRRVLLAALSALDALLLPHLEREEGEMLPVAAQCLSPREWRTWDEATNLRPHGVVQRGLEVHWLLDGAPRGERERLLSRRSAVPRPVLGTLRLAYARKTRVLWSGTPAAVVPALTLENYAEWA
jgi:hypothetical protein